MTQDYREAYIWFSLAAITGHKEAQKSLDIFVKELTATELRSAKEEAKRRLAEIEQRIRKGES